MSNKQHTCADGFTILELMIATMVFAVALLVVAVGVINTTNAYYKGVTSAKTQSTARAIMAEISQAIEFSKTVTQVPAVGSGPAAVCVDNTMYMFKEGQQVTDAPPFTANQGYHGLIEGSSGSCSTPSWPGGSGLPAGSRELLAQHMRLSDLSVNTAGKLHTIHVRVIYGDDDLLTLPVTSANLPNELCQGGAGSQFCAVSDLTTTVEQRL